MRVQSTISMKLVCKCFSVCFHGNMAIATLWLCNVVYVSKLESPEREVLGWKALPKCDCSGMAAGPVHPLHLKAVLLLSWSILPPLTCRCARSGVWRRNGWHTTPVACWEPPSHLWPERPNSMDFCSPFCFSLWAWKWNPLFHGGSDISSSTCRSRIWKSAVRSTAWLTCHRSGRHRNSCHGKEPAE